MSRLADFRWCWRGGVGAQLRQNYNRLAAQANPMLVPFRMRKALCTLQGCTGHVLRDIDRKFGAVPEEPPRTQIQARISEIDCISRGKAHIRHKFGFKIGIATTLARDSGVGMRSMPGDLYDEHTQANTVQQIETEMGVLRRQCLDLYIGARERLISKINAREGARNASVARINWMFDTQRAREKLGHLPQVTSKQS
jgi:hypothetical protein